MSAQHDRDPLDGADIGDTETVTETRDLWLGDLASDDTRGSDRFATHRVTDTEIVTDEYGEQSLRVTVESDVTKRLPRRWDYSHERASEAARQSRQRRRWVGHAITVGVAAICIGIGSLVTRRLLPTMTVNGEPVLPPSLGALFGMMVAVAALVAVVMAAARMPRMGVSR